MLDPPGECRQKKADMYAKPVITKALRIDGLMAGKTAKMGDLASLKQNKS